MTIHFYMHALGSYIHEAWIVLQFWKLLKLWLSNEIFVTSELDNVGSGSVRRIVLIVLPANYFLTN